MEPRIQYAQTKDGVSIAYWTLGEGVPIVQLPSMISHIQLEWQIPQIREWYEHLSERRTLVRYDGRGLGMSTREVSHYSLEAELLDLEAVVERLGSERFTLFGWQVSGPAAIAYAARHPHRVSRLLLWSTAARGIDIMDVSSSRVRAMAELSRFDWDLFCETLAHEFLGWSEAEMAHKVAEYIREGVTLESLMRANIARASSDVTALLPEVRSPTLVLHPRQTRFPKLDVAGGLASRIPDAGLAIIEGTSAAPFLDSETVRAVVDEFLGQGEEAEAEAEPLAKEDTHTILFTDVEGSTALTQRLGDAKARQLLRQHERMVREALKSHGGSEVKTMGDGFMASFSSATKALECAIAMQRAFAQHNESAEEPILVRIGLNAGEPITEDEDLFGTAVNEAARITAAAKGGEILVANVVRELAKGKDFLFADRGETSLRGFEDPVRLFDVRWRE